MNYEHEQFFTGGMKQDINPALQPANSYRYARNGRLLYVQNQTDVSAGKSMTFSNVRGNTLALTLPNGYSLIGSVECRLGVVLFSTNGVDSEIGIWYYEGAAGSIIGVGQYDTLYNDSLDPHILNRPYTLRQGGEPGQDRLNWLPTDGIDAEVYYENDQIERLYWTNRRSAIHTLNLRAKPQTNHPNTGYYPAYWSVHAFRERSDVTFPKVKLLGRGKGTLPSGTYQISAAYRSKSGQRSVYQPVTRRTFVTSEPLDAYNADGSENTSYQANLRVNHHNRVMTASGKVTSESLRWELKNIDIRWDELLVAVLYYETAGQPTHIYQLKPIAITPDFRPSSIIVEIKQLDGIELTIAELNQRFDSPLSVGTLAAFKNRLIAANLTRQKPLSVDASAVTFTPKLVSMRADTTTEPTFNSVYNPISQRNDNDPITNSPVQTSTITIQSFTNVSEVYRVTDDYMHDKGQVWEWLHGSHFGGETYEYATVLLDRQGQPMYATPLPAFTFPERFADGPNGEKDFYALTQKDPISGLYDLRPMGLSISGLRLNRDELFDSEGRLTVSGMMIVRRPRNNRLLHQGVLFPVTRTDDCDEDTGRDKKPFPLPYLNYFDLGFSGSSRHLYPMQTPCRTAKNNVWSNTKSQPYYSVYHSPDVLIEGAIKPPVAGDVLKHIAIAGQAYAQQTVKLFETPISHHEYTKSYSSSTQFPRLAELSKNGRPKLGDTSRIGLSLLHTLGYATVYNDSGESGFDKDDLNLKFETASHPVFSQPQPRLNLYSDGVLQRNSVLMKTLDFVTTDVAESQTKAANFRIVNYIQPLASTSSDQTTESVLPYYSTGHFLPITVDTLILAKQITDQNGQLTQYEFNDVEVWGGDAYVQYFDFTRIYPYHSDSCDRHDYSLSHLIPIETKYNLLLRPGRTFAKNAVRPEETTCDNGATDSPFINGIMPQQPEDWNYNRALLVDTTVNSFAIQPRDQLVITEQPNGFSWTPVKQNGQLLDAWRMRLAGDYGEADGSLGTIKKLVKSEFQGLYCWQDRGFGIIPLDPLEMRANDAGTVVTTSGSVFHQMVYISRQYGTQHPDSVWRHSGQMGAWDARKGVLLRHTQAGLDVLSQSENLNDTLQLLTLPLAAGSENAMQTWLAQAGVDEENSEILLTFKKANTKPITLVYSLSLSQFTSFYDCLPSRYGNRGRILFSVSPQKGNELWLHNRGNYGQWYGVYSPTVLQLIVNPSGTVNKTFDNGAVNVDEEGYHKISRITHWTPNGKQAQHHELLVADDDRFQFWNNELRYPMHEYDWDDVKQRLRDHYMYLELEITNDDSNTPVSITSFRTLFRLH